MAFVIRPESKDTLLPSREMTFITLFPLIIYLYSAVIRIGKATMQLFCTPEAPF
jgi:hypothetical protein